MASGRNFVIRFISCVASTFTATAATYWSNITAGTACVSEFRPWSGVLNFIVALAEPLISLWGIAFPAPAHPVGWGSAFISERQVFEAMRARFRAFRGRIAERVQSQPGAPLFGGVLAGSAAGCI